MPSLVFSSAKLNVKNRTLDLTSGTFYVHLVTTVPIVTNTTVADLVLATEGTYAAQTATGVGVAADGTGVKVTLANPTWVGLTTNNAATIKGMVLIKQIGGSPANTDPLIAYGELTSPYTPPVTATDLSIIVPSTGIWKED
jgi:hypothetical protein